MRVKYIKHVVRDEGDASFLFSTSVVCFQVRCHTATALWSLSHQRQAKVHGSRKFFENSPSCQASWKNFQRQTNTSKSTLLRTRKDLARSVTSTDHGADHSFLATFLCLEELTINSATVFAFLF